jgi:transposase
MPMRFPLMQLAAPPSEHADFLACPGCGTQMPKVVTIALREVLRLKFVGGVPNREIARRIGMAPSTVRTTIGRFQAAGLSWPLPDEMTDAALEARLFPEAGTRDGHRRQTEPDWANIQRELKRKHVTLSLLWHEYIERNPEGYRYSRFCDRYRSWERKLSVTMRQTHLGGDKLFVDYAGDTMPVIVDRLTGEVRGDCSGWLTAASARMATSCADQRRGGRSRHHASAQGSNSR